MKELNHNRRSPSVSTLKYEMNSDCFTSSKRHGWAPAKNQSDVQGQRPLSFAGKNILLQQALNGIQNYNRFVVLVSYYEFHITAFPSGSSTAESSRLDDGIDKYPDISNSWAAELNLNNEDSDARLYNDKCYLFSWKFIIILKRCTSIEKRY